MVAGVPGGRSQRGREDGRSKDALPPELRERPHPRDRDRSRVPEGLRHLLHRRNPEGHRYREARSLAGRHLYDHLEGAGERVFAILQAPRIGLHTGCLIRRTGVAAATRWGRLCRRPCAQTLAGRLSHRRPQSLVTGAVLAKYRATARSMLDRVRRTGRPSYSLMAFTI